MRSPGIRNSLRVVLRVVDERRREWHNVIVGVVLRVVRDWCKSGILSRVRVVVTEFASGLPRFCDWFCNDLRVLSGA